MDQIQQGPAAIATAVAVGGFVLMLGAKYFGGEKKPAEEAPEEEAVDSGRTGSKKNKKKNKKAKKGAAAQAEPEVVEKVAVAAAEPQEKNQGGKKKAAKAVEPPQPAVEEEEETGQEDAGAKKKKKKKKKKAAAADGAGAAAQPAKTEAAAPAKKKQDDLVAAAAAAAAAAAQEDGDFMAEEWETVSRKKKKPLVAPNQDDVSVNVEGSKASVTLEIGDFVSIIIGPGGSRISQIQSTSGAKVDVDKTSKVCTITGDVDAVNNAKAQIIDIIGDQRKAVVELGPKRNLVFGQGGETIRKIQADSGARLDLERGSSVCTISGKSQAVERARNMIEDILNSTNVATVALEEKDRPAILGKGGENIRKLQTDSGAVVELDGESGCCTITGEPSQVAKAKELIRLYIEHRGPPPEAVESLTVNIDHGRLLIGKSGATVTKIQADTGARVNIVHSIATSTITISGGKEEVSRCVSTINKFIADNSYSEEVSLSSGNLARAIIGEKGAFVNKIRDDSNARLDITDQKVVITGTKQQVQKARRMVQGKIDEELGPPPTKAGEIQHSFDLGGATGKIIGSSGSNIARLEKEYGVSVIVKNGTQCYVTGPKEGADKAKKEIDETLERHKDLIEKAKKQEEELAKVAAQNGMVSTSADSSTYSGWDVPVLDRTWGSGLAAETPAWGAPQANGW